MPSDDEITHKPWRNSDQVRLKSPRTWSSPGQLRTKNRGSTSAPRPSPKRHSRPRGPNDWSALDVALPPSPTHQKATQCAGIPPPPAPEYNMARNIPTISVAFAPQQLLTPTAQQMNPSRLKPSLRHARPHCRKDGGLQSNRNHSGPCVLGGVCSLGRLRTDAALSGVGMVRISRRTLALKSQRGGPTCSEAKAPTLEREPISGGRETLSGEIRSARDLRTQLRGRVRGHNDERRSASALLDRPYRLTS